MSPKDWRPADPIIQKQKCLRCGWVWYPKRPDPPLRCANQKCKSPYWRRPKALKEKRKP